MDKKYIKITKINILSTIYMRIYNRFNYTLLVSIITRKITYNLLLFKNLEDTNTYVILIHKPIIKLLNTAIIYKILISDKKYKSM